ncbi:MAG: hypothetical protein AAGA30_05370, partial [Planctomycetota bacterium]
TMNAKSPRKVVTSPDLLIFVACLFVLLGPQVGAAWQDDPFDPFGSDATAVDDFGDEADTEIEFESATEDSALGLDDLDDGVELVIRSVRNSMPTSAQELSRAIKTMLNLRQYGEAKKYLQKLISLRPDRTQLFELAESMGADFFLDVRDIPELQPEGREFAKLAFKSAKEEAFGPNRIAELISQLSDENQFERQEAFRKLKLLGAPAVAAMLEVCDDRGRRKEVPFIQAALKRMGNDAVLPLVGAVRADGTIAQAVAVGVLSGVETNLANDAILRTAISSRVPESVRVIAADAVGNRGYDTVQTIKDQIFKRANAYLDGRVSLPIDGKNQVDIWNWNLASKKLVPTKVTSETAFRILAVDLARDLFRMEPENPTYRKLQLLTVLDATKRVLGPDRSILKDEVTPFMPDLVGTDVDLVLRDALDRELYHAAIGAAEVAGQMNETGLVAGRDGRLSPLVEALISGHRSLQFAAAKAIAELDPKSSFPGCSYMAKIMTYLANSGGNAAAVVMHPKQETAQALASSVFQSGFVGLTANTPQELFNTLEFNPDVEFVVVTDSTSNPHYHELVQQIRGFWMSRNLPIGLTTQSSQRERDAELLFDEDPLTVVLPATSNPGLVFNQMKRLSGLRLPTSVSNVQRNQHAEFALGWINNVLSAPEEYGFYGLQNYRQQLGQVTRMASSLEIRTELLKNLGNADSQNELWSLANDEAYSLTERRQFVSAFSEAVGRRGLLLSRQNLTRLATTVRSGQQTSKESEEILLSLISVIEKTAEPSNH